MTKSNLLGRSQDIKKIIPLIKTKQLVTILGMGGVGKSILAQAVGQEMSAEMALNTLNFEDTQNICIEDVLLRFSNILKINSFSDEKLTLKILAHHLGQRPYLFIFDGCEQSPTINQWLPELLHTCPTLKILATSREPLGIPGETFYHLSPLSTVPKHGNPSDAASLFMERASQLDGSFEPTPEVIAEVEQIARLMDGLPLAMHLTAPLVQIMTPEAIINLLKEDAAVLLTETDPKGRRFLGMLHHTWSFLSEDERQWLCKISFLEGSFTWDAALAISGSNLAALRNLFNRSLLMRVENHRFQIHALLRNYAREIASSAIKDEASRSFVTYYLGLLSKPASQISPDDYEHIIRAIRLAPALNLLSDVIDNLETLRRISWQNGFMARSAAVLADLQKDILPSFGPSAPAISKIRLFEASLRSHIGQYHKSIAILDEANPHINPESDRSNGLLLHYQYGTCHFKLGNFAEALSHLTHAQRLSDNTKALYLEINILRLIGLTNGYLGDHNQKIHFLQDALKLSEKYNLLESKVEILTGLALDAADRAELANAHVYAKEALTHAKTLNNAYFEGLAHNVLGGIQAKQGDLYGGLVSQLTSRDLFRQRGELHSEAVSEFQMCAQYAVVGDFENARACAERHYYLCGLTKATVFSGWVEFALANVDLCERKPDLAEGHAKAGADFGKKYQNPRMEAVCNVLLAKCSFLKKNIPGAKAYLSRAYSLWETTSYSSGILMANTLALEIARTTDAQHQAKQLCETIITALSDHELQLNERTFSAYLECYKALVWLRDERAATLLETGYTRLMKIANLIPDAALQNCFLTQIPDHNELVHLYAGIKNAENNLLTYRQLEVLKLMAVGLNNQEIADQLYISVETARRHVSDILYRLDVKNRSKAVHKAHTLGLLP